MRRGHWIFLAIVFLCLLPVVTTAIHHEIKVYINGEKFDNKAAPERLDGQVYLPSSVLSDGLKLPVQLENAAEAANIQFGNQYLEVQAGRSTVSINGNSSSIDYIPFVKHGELYIPIDILDESLGLKLQWDRLTSSVFIFQQKNGNNSTGSEQNPLETRPPTESEIQPQPSEIQPPQTVVESEPPLATEESPESVPLPDEYEEAVSEDGHTRQAQFSGMMSTEEGILLEVSGATQPIIHTLPAPERLIIDLPQTEFASTFNGEPAHHIGDLTSFTPEVKQIRYSVFNHEPPTIRIVLETNGRVDYQLTKDPEQDHFFIEFKKSAASQGQYQVVIDAGHGGKDPGAEGASEREEKEFTLEISKKVEKLLQNEPQITPIMTRTEDRYLSLNDRAEFANALGADLFISLHGNTYETPISGTETYYWHDYSAAFAEVMHEHVIQGTRLPDRNVRKEPFRVLKETTMPAVLLELGYLSNPADEKIMLTEEFQDRVAQYIVFGLKDHLGLQ